MVLDAISGLLGASAPPALRRPTFQVTLGSDVSDYVAAIAVEAGLLPAVDGATVDLINDSRVELPAPGDSAQLAMGYADDETSTVFSGYVLRVQRHVTGHVRVTLANGSASLARLRLDRSYNQQSAGEIVQDLLGEVGASAGSVENGPTLPRYAMHSGQTALHVVTKLARSSGFLAYMTPDGELDFKPPADGQPVQTFTYGGDIVALHVVEGDPLVGTQIVSGEGAAGSEGSDAWSWFVKDSSSVTHEAGGGDPIDAWSDPALRSAEAVQQAAEGRVAAEQGLAVTGTLVVPGAPAAVAGSVIAIEDAPADELNGTYLVRWVRHRYDKRQGFMSTIGIAQLGGAGGGLLDLVGGLL